MNEWSVHRKRIVMGLVLLCLIILVGIPVLLYFHQAPLCIDGKQNGDETGVDCGGSCSLICPASALPLIAKGDPQVIPVSTSTYDVIAYIQNPNIDGKAVDAPYTLSVFDASSATPLKVINLKTFIPQNSSFAIFQGPFDFGSSTPSIATLEWGSISWTKDKTAIPELTVKNVLLSQTDKSPRLTATVFNNTLKTISNIEFVALIYDESGNIVHASRTVVDALDPSSSAPLVYTWPKAFTGTTTTIEIVPRIFPTAASIR